MSRVIRSQKFGEELLILKSAADTGGELLVMEGAYAPNQKWETGVEHLHPIQEERFKVLEGMISVRIRGEEKTYVAGESFQIPPRTAHLMRNLASVPARLYWETRPALKTEEFFETVFGLADAEKLYHPLQFAVVVMAFRDVFQITQVPSWLQPVLFGPLAWLGRLLGYSARAPQAKKQAVRAGSRT